MNRDKKTLFIIVDSGITIRNILRTDVLRILKERGDIFIVIFSPIADERFRSEFESDAVKVEPLDALPQWKPASLWKMVRSLRKEVWAESQAGLTSFKIKRGKKKRGLLRSAIRRLQKTNVLQRIFGTLSRIEWRVTPPLDRTLIERYHPDLIFFSHLYTKFFNIGLAAKQNGVKIISQMQSWDNPTTRGFFPFIPDRIIVWNETLKRELQRFHGYPAERILISGVPQFDLYRDRANFQSREAFFRKWGLDPDKKLITYTGGSDGLMPDEHEVVDLFRSAIAEKLFGAPVQFLVRLHPKSDPSKFEHFKKDQRLVLQRPGRAAATRDNWDPTREDMYGLAELMRYSDVVINIASTITIDAACFDTPVVNVAFDGLQQKPYLDSYRRYYDYNHYRNILKSGGVRLSHNLDEAIDNIRFYLEHPEADREGRRRIVEEQAWRLDGKAGERIAGCIIDSLQG